MKYREFKHLVDVILTGDTAVPEDEAYLLSAMRYAFEIISMKCGVTKLTLTDAEFLAYPIQREIVRRDFVNQLVFVRAAIPKKDDDDIDLDEGLCFTGARLVASLFSLEKMQYHREIAMAELNEYSKVQQAMKEMELHNVNYTI